MICGIYKITNRINGHYYIGQSVDIKSRLREHKHSGLCVTNKDHYTPIHSAIFKYGWESFEVEILEECPREKLDTQEKYWIEQLSATKNGNYNILLGGQDRMKFDNKPVELYDLEGHYVRTIESATKVAEELEVSKGTIYQVLHKQRPTCKNYQMKYAEDKETKIQKFISRQGGSISVNQIHPITNEILATYSSAAEASRITGADSSAIIKVCKGKLKTTKGYKWSYAEDNK